MRRPLAAAVFLGIALALIPALPAHADNCSTISDCSFGVTVALALLAIVLAIALWYLLAPLISEMLAAAAARSLLADGILAAIRANTMRHIFGKAAHNLAGLVARVGSERAVMAATARAGISSCRGTTGGWRV